jgi:hypothetical protein
MSERKAVAITGVTLKCDAPRCGYERPVPAITRDLIGEPCPKCAHNLLTEEDFLSAKMLEVAADALNALFPIPPDAPIGNTTPVSVNPHAGTWTVKVETE